MIIKSTRNSVVVAALFSVLSGISTFGTAALEAVDVKSVRVSFADLDLSREEGRQTLYQRLRGAADRVCEKPVSKAAREIREHRECYEDAMDKALREVGSRKLASLHSG